MLEILEPIFRGHWRPYGESLQLCDGPGSRPSIAQWFSDPENLRASLTRHTASLRAPGEIKAVASDWSLRYFQTLLPPLIGAASVLGRRMPSSWHEMTLDMKMDGTPAAFRIPHLGDAGHEGAAPRYECLVWQHLRPVVNSISAEAHVPAKILWGNAHRTLTNIFAQALTLLSPDPSRSQRLREDREQLLTQPLWLDGRRNPLALRTRQITVAGGGAALTLHATCCLAYRLPHDGYCGACPLAPPHRKKRGEMARATPTAAGVGE